MREEATASALDAETSSLERTHLVAGAEVRWLERVRDFTRWLDSSGQDEGEAQGHYREPKVEVVTARTAGQLLAAGYRNMEVAAALVINVHRYAGRFMLTVMAPVRTNHGFAFVRMKATMLPAAHRMVHPAVHKGDAEHLS